ncbi:MAG: nicotinate-nucleotide adenylyltransferase [Bryobacteraceae bacterium]|nr:nicotinate-nucleotide adenylyltransferase [Bryobacteraceae bacterium]MDW8378385.1 nicotinate-nucleotide adenylyltransferase [Bryobacterales bacterium]
MAIYGGTFDPIHKAHLQIAAEAVRQFRLDRVLFIPAANPPHKQATHTPYFHRLRMAQIACQHEPRFVVSNLEEGVTKSYSYYTILRVRATLDPHDELFFLLGADAFAEIDTWHRSREVLELVDFLVVSRPGHRYQVPPGARVHRLDSLALAVSSSAIRAQLARGETPEQVPPEVLAYIREHHLYQAPQESKGVQAGSSPA